MPNPVNQNAPTVTNALSDPVIDANGNVTLVVTTTTVYTANQYMVYQATLQSQAAQAMNQAANATQNVASINAALAAVAPIAAKVQTALASIANVVANPVSSQAGLSIPSVPS